MKLIYKITKFPDVDVRRCCCYDLGQVKYMMIEG